MTVPPIASQSEGKRVFKYPVGMPDERGRAWVDLPGDADLLSAGLQGDKMVVWALTDPDFEPEEHMQASGPHRLIVVNTGWLVPEFPEGARFLGTVTASNGTVWHIWDGDAETSEPKVSDGNRSERGEMEAAGIEPALGSSGNMDISRGFSNAWASQRAQEISEKDGYAAMFAFLEGWFYGKRWDGVSA